MKLNPRTLLKIKISPPAPTLPSLPTPQVARIPFLPPEVVAHILSYYCIHAEPITLLPTHETIDWQEGFDEHKPLPYAPFTPKTPFQSHKAPMINLLLTNKQFHDEVMKQFYSKNIFTFLHGDHDEVWINTNGTKRTRVRHIQLESLWELDMIFSQDKTKPQEVEAVFTLKPIWGGSDIEDLMESHDTPTMFPNLQSITQKIRLRYNKDSEWPFNASRIVVFTDKGDTMVVGKDIDLLIHKQARDSAKRMIAGAIKAGWDQLKMGPFLTKMEMGFMYAQTLKWDDEIAMKPILSLVGA